jgi:site-specific recombinase XerD
MKLTLRFTLRNQKTTTHDAPIYIYLKIRVNGVAARSAMATGVCCYKKEWDNKTQSIRGRSDLVAEKNRQIERIKTEITALHTNRLLQGKPVTAELLKSLYVGKGASCIADLLKMSGAFLASHKINLSGLSFEKYTSYHHNLISYVEDSGRKDVGIEEIDSKWAKAYYQWHQTKRNNCRNTAAKNLGWLKKIINYAVEESALPYNTIAGLRVKRDPQKPILYITETEMQKLHNCVYFDDRLRRIADCFLIQCYTGMAYNEMLQFRKEAHLQLDPQNRQWIVIYRGKTKELCRIPLLEPARVLLEKYGYKPPVISNQKMNEYLKEVATVAQLEKPELLTTHVGRRTAGTYLLNRGVPLLTVSKILGHKSIRMTERHYAALLTETIYKDVAAAGLV